MTRDEYNKKVQAMQEVWPDSATRVVREPAHPQDKDRRDWAKFQIYFDHWNTVGTQRGPFQPDAEYEWNESMEIWLMAHFARGVTSDRPVR